MEKVFTPKDLVRLGIGSTEHVLGLIHDGEIEASNVSRSSTRPRWVITRKAVEEFLTRRSNQQTPKPSKAKDAGLSLLAALEVNDG